VDGSRIVRATSQTFLVPWVAACVTAASIGASLSLPSLAPGLPRLIFDALLVGLLQGVALRSVVRPGSWLALTAAGLGLALVVGVVGVVATGLAFAALGNENPLYVGLIYGLGAIVAGLVVGFVQGVGLPQGRRLTPWLLGTAFGAPFVFPALAFSWFPQENVTTSVPAVIVGLVGGLAYGVISGVGLREALRESPE